MRIIDDLANHVMLPFLNFSYIHIFPNYGIGIILLTILVKIILFPLTLKQTNAMQRLQKIHPQLKEIQKKYKADPQKLQKETVRLYQESGVNPLGGCIPLLVQLPFLFALFRTMNSGAFRTLILREGVYPGFVPVWLPDLSQSDPFFILPIIIGVTTYYSQKLTPTTMDPQQAKIMAFVPLLMVAICFRMPSGVLLYWAVSQGFSIIQQLVMMRYFVKEGA